MYTINKAMDDDMEIKPDVQESIEDVFPEIADSKDMPELRQKIQQGLEDGSIDDIQMEKFMDTLQAKKVEDATIKTLSGRYSPSEQSRGSIDAVMKDTTDADDLLSVRDVGEEAVEKNTVIDDDLDMRKQELYESEELDQLDQIDVSTLKELDNVDAEIGVSEAYATCLFGGISA